MKPRFYQGVPLESERQGSFMRLSSNPVSYKSRHTEMMFEVQEYQRHRAAAMQHSIET